MFRPSLMCSVQEFFLLNIFRFIVVANFRFCSQNLKQEKKIVYFVSEMLKQRNNEQLLCSTVLCSSVANL